MQRQRVHSGFIATVGGDVTFVDTNGGFGGKAAEFDMEVSVGAFDGRWLLFSLVGSTIPAGYYHLTTLNITSLESYNCDPQFFGLQEAVVTTIQVGCPCVFTVQL